jgi:predicted nucleic acid-binding protein
VRDVRDLLIYFDILGFTEDLAIIHAQLTVDLDNRGKPNGILDPLIASIVLSAVESIITRNADHF